MYLCIYVCILYVYVVCIYVSCFLCLVVARDLIKSDPFLGLLDFAFPLLLLLQKLSMPVCPPTMLLQLQVCLHMHQQVNS